LIPDYLQIVTLPILKALLVKVALPRHHLEKVMLPGGRWFD
jgi:hypothetical protein